MQYQLIGLRGPQSGRVFVIAQGQVVWLGRTPEATIPISSVLASRRHAEIRIEPSGVIVRDLGSANGTRVNGQKITARPLGPGDVVEIGDEAFRFAWGAADAAYGASKIVGVRGPQVGRSFPVGNASLSFGRAPECTVVIHSTRASRRHAEIRFEAAGLVLYDLGSGNGTQVNGVRITSRTLVHGDRIEIGDEMFGFDAAGSSARMRAASPLATSNTALEPSAAASIDAMRQTLPTDSRFDPMSQTSRIDVAAVLGRPAAPVPAPPVSAPVPPAPAGAPVAAPPAPPKVAVPADFSLSVRCPRCGRAVDARFADCPWDGAALVNGKSIL